MSILQRLENDKYSNILKVELHKLLINPKSSTRLLEELKSRDEYLIDPKFRLIVNSLATRISLIKGDYKSAKVQIQNNLNEAINLAFPIGQAYNYYLVGRLYFAMSNNSKAIEAFLSVVKTEEQNKFSIMTSYSMCGIAIIFDDLNDIENSIHYYHQAERHSNLKSVQNEHDLSAQIFAMGNLLIRMAREKNMEEVDRLHQELSRQAPTKLNKLSRAKLNEAMMHYHILKGDYKRANTFFEISRDILLRYFNDDSLYRLVVNYAEVCYENQMDYSYYAKNLEDSLKYKKDEYSSFLYRICYILNQYYKSINDEKKLKETNQLYLHFSEKNNEEKRKDYLHSIKKLNSYFSVRENNILIKKQNEKLRKLTIQLDEANYDLDGVWKRLNFLNSIGKKIVSSTDINSILSLIKDNVKALFPRLSSFTVFIIDEDAKYLKSIVFYENDNSYKSIPLSLESTESYNVKCFLESKTIIMNDLENHFKNLEDPNPIFKGIDTIESAMFIPITYDNKVIGVLSLQSEEKMAFSQEHQQFFESLSQFLAIAFRNIKHSENLQKEIKAHKYTQQKLQMVNKELKKLSTLDSLTHIYNRRQFDRMYAKLIKKAIKYGSPLSVCLFDIDNFKNYNDTYGHLEGDQVLIKVANIIKKGFDKKSSVVARFGGEEFIAVQIGKTETEIYEALNNICSTVRGMGIVNEKSVKGILTISIGVATSYSPSMEIKSDIMRQADECLYDAKSNGKDRVVQIIV